MRKDSPKNMAKESLMLHLQGVNCTAYHQYRRGYIKITEYMPEKRLKGCYLPSLGLQKEQQSPSCYLIYSN